MGNVLDKSCREIKTHILCLRNFSEKCIVWDNSEKCGWDRGATDDVTTWRIRLVCWISKATCTYSHARALTHRPTRNIYFPQQQWLAKTPHCYVICTSPLCSNLMLLVGNHHLNASKYQQLNWAPWRCTNGCRNAQEWRLVYNVSVHNLVTNNSF